MRKIFYILLGITVIGGVLWGGNTLTRMEINRKNNVIAARAALTPCQVLINDIKTAYWWNLIKGNDSVANLNMAINSYVKIGGEAKCEKSIMSIMNEARLQ